MPCVDPALGAQEQALLAARAATTRHSITGDVLALAGANGPLARSTATEMR
jgi:heat shock protein HslJ